MGEGLNRDSFYFFKDYTGWRRRLFAALLGAMATLALPPIYLLLLLIPAFSGLFLLVRGAKTLRQAFWDGWWWGLGHFTTGLYWMCVSLYVEPEKFAWMTPFALFGVPSVVAIYTGLVTAVFVAGWQLSVAGKENRWQPATGNRNFFSFLPSGSSSNICARICSPDFPGT